MTRRGGDGRAATLAGFKGAIREVEMHPGHAAEWWFVPVAAGTIADLRRGAVGADGRSHAGHGMVGRIVIERPLGRGRTASATRPGEPRRGTAVRPFSPGRRAGPPARRGRCR